MAFDYAGVPTILLGSQSPRRLALLEGMGLRCEVLRGDFDERAASDSHPTGGMHLAEFLALGKLRAIALRAGCRAGGGILLTADTVVMLDGERLDKPQDEAQALERLMRLSGREHEVVTGLALSYRGRITSLSETTHVQFAPFDERYARAYIASGSPYDKAGGYGIQDWFGLGAVVAIRGSYTNVMGLPTHRVHHYLMANFT
ncbi:MAG: septum formation protein Maf [Bacteroidia bacterium]|nr:MAG: septum formation protein Maf [Bacteroidia bacterium]